MGVLAKTVEEVTCRGGDHRPAFAHLGLVAPAQAAARHFGARTGGSEDGVMAFFDQLTLVHLGRWGHPQLDGDVALTAEQLGGCSEVTDVGHARADKSFVDVSFRDLGQELSVIGVVGAAGHGLCDMGQIDLDLDDVGVFRILIRFEQYGCSQLGFDFLDAARQGASVGVVVRNQLGATAKLVGKDSFAAKG